MPVQIGATTHSFASPTGLLTDCHRRVETFLGALQAAAQRAGTALSADDAKSLANALRYFREAAPKHTADEEESLFPRLRRMSDPELQQALAELDRLEADHRWAEPLHRTVEELGQRWVASGRLEEKEAGQFRGAVEELARMYRRHIDVEEKLVFPVAARVLPEPAKAEIAQEMAKRRGV